MALVLLESDKLIPHVVVRRGGPSLAGDVEAVEELEVEPVLGVGFLLGF